MYAFKNVDLSHCTCTWNKFSQSTFLWYAFREEGGGMYKEYSLYACENADNYGWSHRYLHTINTCVSIYVKFKLTTYTIWHSPLIIIWCTITCAGKNWSKIDMDNNPIRTIVRCTKQPTHKWYDSSVGVY